MSIHYNIKSFIGNIKTKQQSNIDSCCNDNDGNNNSNTNSIVRKRILSVDYGTRKIGFAVSDEERKIAFPKEVALGTWNDQTTTTNLIISRIDKYKSIALVIGYPRKLDNSLHNNCVIIDKIVSKIEETLEDKSIDFPILLFDERYTTALANSVYKTEMIHDRNRKTKASRYQTSRQNKYNKNKNSNQDDARAACVILNDVLTLLNNSEN